MEGNEDLCEQWAMSTGRLKPDKNFGFRCFIFPLEKILKHLFLQIWMIAFS